jgi:hypothetical protein
MTMIPIFDAGRQLWKIRMIGALSLVVAAMLVWLGAGIVAHYGEAPGEGGALAPLATRVVLGGLVIALGAAFPVGMWIYGRCYVLSAALDDASRRLRITHPGLFLRSSREVAAGELEEPRYHDGRMDTHRMRVDAPWYSLRLRGRRLPLLLDAQGDFLDRERVSRVLLRETGAAEPAQTRRP